MVLKIAQSMTSGLSQVVEMKTIHTTTKSGKEEFEEVVSSNSTNSPNL